MRQAQCGNTHIYSRAHTYFCAQCVHTNGKPANHNEHHFILYLFRIPSVECFQTFSLSCIVIDVVSLCCCCCCCGSHVNSPPKLHEDHHHIGTKWRQNIASHLFLANLLLIGSSALTVVVAAVDVAIKQCRRCRRHHLQSHRIILALFSLRVIAGRSACYVYLKLMRWCRVCAWVWIFHRIFKLNSFPRRTLNVAEINAP